MPHIEGEREENGGAEERYKIVLTPDDKKKLIIAAVVILAVLAAATILLGSIQKTPLAECEGILLQQNRYSCLQNLAFSTVNTSVCSHMPYPYNDSCVSRIAENTNSISACGEISGSTFYNQCVLNVSSSLGDSSYCSRISNSTAESECVYGVAKASSFGSLSYCQQMPDSYYAGLCSSMYYYERAVSLGNASYCSFLADSSNSSLLLNMSDQGAIASNYISYNISAALFLAISNTTPRSYCYYETALHTGNQSLCLMASGAAADLCTFSFYSKSNVTPNYTNLNASSICASLPASLKDYCILGVGTAAAENTDNVSICMGFSGQEQYSCISAIASKYNDTSYCSYISNSTARSTCYMLATNRTS